MEEIVQRQSRAIVSFVLLNIKTINNTANNTPLNLTSDVAIEEFCLYGISLDQLAPESILPIDNVQKLEIPKQPRIVHKLSIKSKTGEKNDLFNDIFVPFIAHMRKPTCLVAYHDLCFPIIKHKLDKLRLKMPPNTFCMDATKAFRDLVEQTTSKSAAVDNADNQPETMLTLTEQLDAENKTNWQAYNETTPNRKVGEKTGVRRGHANDLTPTTSRAALQKVKRKLFESEPNYNNSYELADIHGRMFKRIYGRKKSAEADVISLMHLIQVYGGRFSEYARNHAVPYEEIMLNNNISQINED